MIAKVCDVIQAEAVPGELVVVSTQTDRLQAATILTEGGLSLPGTYLPKHLGELSVIGRWGPEQTARALAEFMFRSHPVMQEESYRNWLSAISKAMTEDPEYSQ